MSGGAEAAPTPPAIVALASTRAAEAAAAATIRASLAALIRASLAVLIRASLAVLIRLTAAWVPAAFVAAATGVAEGVTGDGCLLGTLAAARVRAGEVFSAACTADATRELAAWTAEAAREWASPDRFSSAFVPETAEPGRLAGSAPAGSWKLPHANIDNAGTTKVTATTATLLVNQS